MQILLTDALAGLRAALDAGDDARTATFDARVVQPLRPFWERFMRMRPQARPAHELTPYELARGIGLRTPQGDEAETRRALDALDGAGSFAACARALDDAIARLAPAAHGVAVDSMHLAVALADPAHMDPRMDNYTGVGMIPGHLLVTVWPTDFNVPRLRPIVAHELNHNVRFRVEPWHPTATTVGKYLVDEGVAECFAAEMYGASLLGRWATGLDAGTLDALVPRYRDALDVTGFNEIRGWIFGDWSAEKAGHAKHGLPDFAGYAMGYRVVRAFLDRTTMTAAEATYVPWRRIIDESGVF